MGMKGCREESRDLTEQRFSPVSSPILTEADYALLSALTHLGRAHKPRLVDVCVMLSVKKAAATAIKRLLTQRGY